MMSMWFMESRCGAVPKTRATVSVRARPIRVVVPEWSSSVSCSARPGGQEEGTPVASRRDGLMLAVSGLAAMSVTSVAGPAKALPGFKKDLNKGRKLREQIDRSAFTAGPDGLLYQDIVVGDGPVAQEGSRVAVHFDAKWRGITFVTTRQGMGVTGGSPFGFDVGAPPNMGGTLKGLDLGVRGMRVGGQRRLIVPAKLAYGEKGYGEIPPGAELTVDVALLSIKTSAVGYQVKIVEG